jgi:RHS repeat-associated protein
MTRGSSTSYSYDKADRITSAGSTSYTVNANGNVTARGSDTFVYDQANRLTSATVGGVTSTYAYDGDGRRISKTVGGNTTNYVYDVNGGLPTVLDDGSRKYVWGLGLADAVDTSANPSSYLGDGLRSVRGLTNANGIMNQTYQTDEFGVPSLSLGGSSQPFGYTGEQTDETGLIYLRARMYDPVVGRFLQRDPAGCSTSAVDPQALNRFSYVESNPVNDIDPSGKQGLFCPVIFGLPPFWCAQPGPAPVPIFAPSYMYATPTATPIMGNPPPETCGDALSDCLTCCRYAFVIGSPQWLRCNNSCYYCAERCEPPFNERECPSWPPDLAKCWHTPLVQFLPPGPATFTPTPIIPLPPPEPSFYEEPYYDPYYFDPYYPY